MQVRSLCEKAKEILMEENNVQVKSNLHLVVIHLLKPWHSELTISYSFICNTAIWFDGQMFYLWRY